MTLNGEETRGRMFGRVDSAAVTTFPFCQTEIQLRWLRYSVLLQTLSTSWSVLQEIYRILTKTLLLQQRRMSHEQPVIYYSCILGGIGPILVVAVPPLRKSLFGYEPAEAPPASYPRQSPISRVREQVV